MAIIDTIDEGGVRLETQLTIFDVFADMDAEVHSIYDDFLADDYHFQESNKKTALEMFVVCKVTAKKLFQINISFNKQGMYLFSYKAMDSYWSGNYTTSRMDEIRKSIRKLVDDERSDRGIVIGDTKKRLNWGVKSLSKMY